MNDLIRELASSTKCSMALFPCNGGEWASPINPDGTGPQPTVEPYEFGTDGTAVWADLGVKTAVGMDDWEFGGEFYVTELVANKLLFYRSKEPRFGLYVLSTTRIQLVNYSVTGGAERICYLDPTPLNQWVKWKIQRVNGWIRCEVDDVEILARDYTGKYISMDSTTSLQTNAVCQLRNCYFKNLTKERLLWRYPTPLEQFNLVQMSNVNMDHGSFVPVSLDNVPTYVQTPIDYQGTSRNFSVVCKFRITPRDLQSNDNHIYGQGYHHNGQSVVGLLMYIVQTATPTRAFFLFNCGCQDSVGKFIGDANVKTDEYTIENFYAKYANRDLISVGVVNWETRKVSFWLDGELIRETSLSANAAAIRDYRGLATIASRPFSLFKNNYRAGGGLNPGMCSIDYLLTFDYAMSAEEIKRLT